MPIDPPLHPASLAPTYHVGMMMKKDRQKNGIKVWWNSLGISGHEEWATRKFSLHEDGLLQYRKQGATEVAGDIQVIGAKFVDPSTEELGKVPAGKTIKKILTTGGDSLLLCLPPDEWPDWVKALEIAFANKMGNPYAQMTSKMEQAMGVKWRVVFENMEAYVNDLTAAGYATDEKNPPTEFAQQYTDSFANHFIDMQKDCNDLKKLICAQCNHMTIVIRSTVTHHHDFSTTLVEDGNLVMMYERSNPVTNTSYFGKTFIEKLVRQWKAQAGNAEAFKNMTAKINAVTGTTWSVVFDDLDEYVRDLNASEYDGLAYAEFAMQYIDAIQRKLKEHAELTPGFMEAFLTACSDRTITIKGIEQHVPEFSITSIEHGGLLLEYEKEHPVTNTNDFGTEFLNKFVTRIKRNTLHVDKIAGASNETFKALSEKINAASGVIWTVQFDDMDAYVDHLNAEGYDSSNACEYATHYLDAIAWKIEEHQGDEPAFLPALLAACPSRIVTIKGTPDHVPECSKTSAVDGGLLLEYEIGRCVTNTNDFGATFFNELLQKSKSASQNASALSVLAEKVNQITSVQWEVKFTSTEKYINDLTADGYDGHIYAEFAKQYIDAFAANLESYERESAGIIATIMSTITAKTITIKSTDVHKPDYSIVSYGPNGGLVFEYEKKAPVTNTVDFGKSFLTLLKDTVDYKEENDLNLTKMCVALDDVTNQKWTLRFNNLNNFKNDLDNSDYNGSYNSAQYAKCATEFVEALAGYLGHYKLNKMGQGDWFTKFLKRCKNRVIVLQRECHDIGEKKYDRDWSTTECMNGDLIISYTPNECMKNVCGTGQTFLSELAGIAL